MAEKTLSTNALLHGIEIRSPIEENIKPLLNYSQFRMLKQMKYNWNKKSPKSGKNPEAGKNPEKLQKSGIFPEHLASLVNSYNNVLRERGT